MKHIGYFAPDMCPLTDEDRAINRAIANRLNGGAWHAAMMEADARSVRADEMLANVLQRMDWRRDFYGRIKPIAWSPAHECKTGSVLRQIDNSVCSKCYALKGRYGFK